MAENDMLKLKKQCDAIKRATDTMEKNIGEAIELAESKQNFFVYDQSNVLKRKCDENKADLRVCFCKNIWKDKTGKLDI